MKNNRLFKISVGEILVGIAVNLLAFAGVVEDTSVFVGMGSGILAVGLGNDDVTPDALGPMVLDNLFINRHLRTGNFKIPAIYYTVGITFRAREKNK